MPLFTLLQSRHTVTTWTNHSPAMPFTRTRTKPISSVHRRWFNFSRPLASAAIFSTKRMRMSQACTRKERPGWRIKNKSKNWNKNWFRFLCFVYFINAFEDQEWICEFKGCRRGLNTIFFLQCTTSRYNRGPFQHISILDRSCIVLLLSIDFSFFCFVFLLR